MRRKLFFVVLALAGAVAFSLRASAFTSMLQLIAPKEEPPGPAASFLLLENEPSLPVKANQVGPYGSKGSQPWQSP